MAVRMPPSGQRVLPLCQLILVDRDPYSALDHTPPPFESGLPLFRLLFRVPERLALSTPPDLSIPVQLRRRSQLVLKPPIPHIDGCFLFSDPLSPHSLRGYLTIFFDVEKSCPCPCDAFLLLQWGFLCAGCPNNYPESPWCLPGGGS